MSSSYVLATALCLTLTCGATAQLPIRITDIAPGVVNSDVHWITATQSGVFFRADDHSNGAELWTAGVGFATSMISLKSGPLGSDVREMHLHGGRALFAAYQGITGSELWISDGTPTGTRMLADILPGAPSSYPRHLFSFAGKTYFSANAGTGQELHETDGTPSGTRSLSLPVRDPREFAVLGSGFVFSADDVTHGQELFISDGQPGSASLIKDIRPGTRGSSLSHLFRWRDRVYFAADDGVHGPELWVTDGTPGGTVMLADINPSAGSQPAWFGPLGDRLFFSASAPSTQGGTELWSTDGTAAGTTQFLDIQPGASGSNPAFLTPVGTRFLYFRATDGNHGHELWRTDGTVAGTAMIADIIPGTGSFNPDNEGERCFAVNWSGFYFSGVEPGTGMELYYFHNGATAEPWGAGCDSAVDTLRATDPVLGSTMTIDSDARPTELTGTLLGVPLAGAPSIGLTPGCNLYLNPTTMVTLHLTAAGPSRFQLIIPNNRALSGARLRVQNVKLVLPNGILTSNAVNLAVGD